MKQARIQSRAKGAVISSSILHEPFSALFPLLPFILLKEMSASALHITILAMLKPLMSLLSFFYSNYLLKLNLSLKKSILLTGFFARAPFLIALFFNEPWIYIFACAMYMLFSRASIPPWLELLRLNLTQKMMQKVFSFGSMLAYSIGVVLAVLLGLLLDSHGGFWKLAFALFLCIGLLAVFLQAFLPGIKASPSSNISIEIKPLHEMVSLLKKRPDFLRFQYVFMAGGFGLMLMSPALPNYFCQVLKISYKELLLIFAVCKAIGFVLASPIWQRFLCIETINGFSKSVLAGFLLYAMVLYLAKFETSLIFLAYVIYGVFQAASHLIWHMSGPLFSENQNSAIFSSVNVFTVGLRGCIAPLLGGYISIHYGFYGVFLASSACFLFGLAFIQTVKIRREILN